MTAIVKPVGFVAAATGLAAAAYLTSQHGQEASEAGLCDALSQSGCAIALESKFAEWAGVPVSLLAAGFFVVMAVVLLRHATAPVARAAAWAWLGLSMSLIAVLAGAFLLGAMLYADMVCPMCVAIDVANLVLLIVWSITLLSQRAELPPPQARDLARVTAESGGVFVGLVVGTMVLLGGLAAPAPSAELEAEETATQSSNLRVNACREVELSVLEISDYLCPFCKRLDRALSRELSDCGAEVDKRFVHYPLDASCNRFVSRSIHPFACILAEAAECARQQGAFDRMSSALFERAPRSRAALSELAEELELDTASFRSCLDHGRTRDQIRKDIELAHRLGVRQTPTFYLNGRRLEGALDGARLQSEIQTAIARDHREARAISQAIAPEIEGPNTPDDSTTKFDTEPVESCGGGSFTQVENGCSEPGLLEELGLSSPDP